MDPYATLNVPQDASREQIRSAFARIARSTHPDKVTRTSDGDARAANEAYGEVDEAWKVLGDDQMRAAYDEFGEEGTTALQTLRKGRRGETIQKITRRELKKQVEIMQLMEEDAETGTQTVIRCHSRLENWIQLFKRESTLDSPIFSNIFLQHSTKFDIGNQNTVTLNGVAGSARSRTDKLDPTKTVLSPTLGSLTLVYATARNGNNFEFAWTASALAGIPNQFQAVGARQILPGVMSSVQFRGDPADADLTLGLTTNLTSTSAGQIGMRLGQGGFMNLVLTRKQPLPSLDPPDLERSSSSSSSSGEPKAPRLRVTEFALVLPAANPDLLLSAEWSEPLSLRTGVKTVVAMSLSRGPSMDVESVRKLDERTRISGRVSFGLVTGVSVRFKFIRGSTKVEFPVLISPKFSFRTALGSAFVPWAFERFVRLLIAPWRKQIYIKRREELRQAALDSRKRARNQLALMRPAAEAVKKQQQETDGLVILAARYGQCLDEEYDWSDPELRPNIDVTTQLTFFINKADPPSLDLSEASKAFLLGFYDPSICSVSRSQVWSADEDGSEWWYEAEEQQLFESRKNKLYVRYLYRGFVYEKVFDDLQSVHLPHPDALQVIT